MDSSARIIVIMSFIAGLTVVDSASSDPCLNEASLSKSSNATFCAAREPTPGASRHPYRKTFTVTIYNKTNHHEENITRHDELLSFEWSNGNVSYSFVQNDDVYYVSYPGESPVRVTNHNEDGMLHGTFDWVYAEEIYGRSNGAIWFSPSDKYLAYASRPANSSREVIMTTYARGEYYDYHYGMEYPKTGEKRIAVFSVSIFNVETKKSISLDVQLRDRTSFHYLFGVSWVVLHGKELLVATWANRWQNETSITLCSYENTACSLVYEHKYEPAQWATPDDYAEIVHSNSSIFVILPESKGDNAWQHITKMEITAELRLQSISFLLSGEYDISRIKAYNHNEDVIIFGARAPHPWNHHAFQTPAGERSSIKGDQCLDCPVDEPDWKIEKLILPSGYEAIAQICEGDSNDSSVPVMLYVYGGPDFNTIDTNSGRSRHSTYASVKIDVRGSGGRGWKYRSAVYGKLVTVEVDDTLEALKMVLKRYPRLDKNRVVVHGHSYGGTMTIALVEMAPPGFFKCALASAPVANFMYYDAVYTERYMGDTPASNYTDLTLDVSAFKNTSLMLVHGMRDDNVHFQNSAIMIEALQQAEIPFQLMVYPNDDHFMGHSDNHLKHLRNQFFTDCFA